jgi:hypothetical protein
VPVSELVQQMQEESSMVVKSAVQSPAAVIEAAHFFQCPHITAKVKAISNEARFQVSHLSLLTHWSRIVLRSR